MGSSTQRKKTRKDISMVMSVVNSNILKSIITAYKELLVVKCGTEKFSFHVSPYHFVIEMDDTSFSKIFDQNRKILLLPEANLF